MIIKPFFDEIREAIVNQLEEAKDSISIAVAWFTDKKLFNILLRKLEQNISVQIILCNDAINFKEKGLNWDTFLEKGGKLYAMENSLCLMHHKFVVIDTKTLITGSYNWTYKAVLNRENILVINDHITLINEYLEEFNDLCSEAEHLQQIVYFPASIEMNPVEKKYIEDDRVVEQVLDEEEEDLQGAHDLYEQGLRFHNNMEYKKAIERFEQAMLIEPKWDLLLNATAWSYLRLCEQQPANKTAFLSKALALLETNESLFDDKGIYYNTMGCVYDEYRDYGKAIAFFRKALAIKESNIYYWNLRQTYNSTKSESNVEKIETILHRINADYIKANEKRRANGDIQLMEAYFQRAFLYNIYKYNDDQVLKYVIKAKKAFNALAELDQDMHKYKQIESIVSDLPKAMQKEFNNA
jgi:tetratricopeptide (TPR) repeat protein